MRLPRSSIALAALVGLAWGVVLLAPAALYWDDWVTAGGDVVSLYRDLGLPWVGYVAEGLYALGPVTFKVIGVVCAIVIALAARGIAARGLGLDPVATWITAALVALLPLNLGRIGVAVLSTYSISLAAFLVAWWLLVAVPSRRRLWAVVASLLFFASFTTASLVPFIAVPIAHLAMLEMRDTTGFWRPLLRFALRHWYLIATPAVFWVFRTAFLKPQGVYADYNTFVTWTWPPSTASAGAALMAAVVLAAIVLLVVRIFATANRRSVDVGTAALAACGTIALAATVWLGRGETTFAAIVVTGVIAVAGVAIVGAVMAAARRPELPARIGTSAVLASAGLIAFAFGALPYLLVGKVPQFVDWESRHQVLLPIGTATLAAAALVAVGTVGGRWSVIPRAVGGIAVGLSAIAVIAAGLSLVADWNKQVQVIEALGDLDEVRAASTVVVTDETQSWSFGHRSYRFYEPIGWLRSAFGDSTRFAIDESEKSALESGAYAGILTQGERYGFAGWDPDGTAVAVRIQQLPDASWLDLLVGRPAVDVTAADATLDVAP